MNLTKQILLRAVPTLNKDRVDEFVASFNQWAIPFGINNTKRIVMFLAQIFHESGELKYTEENLNYSAEALLKTFPNGNIEDEDWYRLLEKKMLQHIVKAISVLLMLYRIQIYYANILIV